MEERIGNLCLTYARCLLKHHQHFLLLNPCMFFINHYFLSYQSPFSQNINVSMYKQKHPTAIRAQSIPPKPKRPLTVFNLFGKLERSLILQSAQSLIPLSLERSIREDATCKNKVDPYLELRPERYRYIVSSEYHVLPFV